jgi:UDP-2,3-diacylglucosamine hydrolase
MSSYFISDIHLGLGSKEKEKQKEDRLLAFLAAILPTTESLFIVGDLFDFWFEYGTVIPKGYHRTLAAIQAFTDRNKAVHYLAGNHDFWMGDFFESELGVHLHADPFETTVGGKRIYFHHGDGLSQHDLGYRLIKPILRNRWNIRMYRWLHPDLGVRLARGSSRASRDYTANKDFGEEEGMLRHATMKIHQGVDIVIMGHRHIPDIQSIDGGTYVNLGDWITYRTYGQLTDGSITLQTWDGQQEQSNG